MQVCGIDCIVWLETLVQNHRNGKNTAADQQHIIDFALGRHAVSLAEQLQISDLLF